MPDEKKKYRKWAHRKAYKKKKRRRKRLKRQKHGTAVSTETMLVSLLHQLMPGTLAKKHGENVLTGMAGKVKPDYLSPLWSQHERNFILSRAPRGPPEQGAAAGAAAAVIGAGQGAWGWA